MGDTGSEDYDSDELNEAYEEAWAGLREGTIAWENSDGTFRCPYSPSRKKRDYKYSEIYQHAVGVAKGNRGPVVAGKHCALSEYLAGLAHPSVPRVSHWQQDVPPRVDIEKEDKRVCPWMGVLQNIDVQTQDLHGNFRVGVLAADIKEKLQAFNPESVKILHDTGDHDLVAIIRFQNSMAGFRDAEAFENSFSCKGRGRSDFEKDYPDDSGTHLYGWMATKQDVEGSNKLISDHLKSNGDLKSLPEIVRDLEITSQQLVQSLKELVVKKEGALRAIYGENWSLMNKLDNITAELEQTSKREKQELIDHEKKLDTLQPVASEEHEPTASEGGLSLPSNKCTSSEGEALNVKKSSLLW